MERRTQDVAADELTVRQTDAQTDTQEMKVVEANGEQGEGEDTFCRPPEEGSERGASRYHYKSLVKSCSGLGGATGTS